MTKLSSLPTVSARATLWVLHRIAYTNSPSQYTAEMLAAERQPRTICTLLRFLRLVRRDGELLDGVRGDPDRLRRMVREGFQRACEERGWWNSELKAKFGKVAFDEPQGSEELDRILGSIPAVKRQRSAARRNLLAGLRMLHQFAIQGSDPEWVKSELGSSGAAGVGTKPARSSKRTTPPPGDGLHHPIRPRFEISPSDTVQSYRIPLEFDDNEELRLVVEAWFNPPLTSLTARQVLRLANVLKSFAQAGSLT